MQSNRQILRCLNFLISYSKVGYGDRIGKTKFVMEGGEIFDRTKMRKKENIVPFFMYFHPGWILLTGATVVIIIVFVLLFLHLRN